MENTGSTKHAITEEQMQQPAKQAVGLIVADLGYRRLLEGILVNLEFEPTLLEDSDLGTDKLYQFEMIVSDEAVARKIRPLVKEEQSTGESINPALVAVVAAPLHGFFSKAGQRRLRRRPRDAREPSPAHSEIGRCPVCASLFAPVIATSLPPIMPSIEVTMSNGMQ